MSSYTRQLGEKNNPYHLDHCIWMEVLWMVRSYPADRKRYSEILTDSPELSAGPRGNLPSDPTARKVIRRLALEERIRAVEKALEKIPGPYRKPVLKNVIYEQPWPGIASRSTYSRQKARFMYEVARRMYLI